MSTGQTFRNTLVVLLTLVAAYVVYMSMPILVVLLIAIIVASAVRPLVLWLQKRGFSQGLSIVTVYALLAITIFTLLVLVLPPAADRLAFYLENENGLAARLINVQEWLQRNIQERFGIEVGQIDPEAIRTTVVQQTANLREQMPVLAGQFGGLIGNFVLVFIMGVYWLTSRDQAVEFVTHLFPIGRRAMVIEIIREIETSLGNYVRGVVSVGLFVGFANAAIIGLFGVPAAVTIGFIIGAATMLPIVGGFIGAGLAILTTLITSSNPLHALITFGSFVAVQQVETHYLTPRVMGQSVGLNPILIITFLFVGFALGGVIGGLIAVPIAGTIMILLRYLIIQPQMDGAEPVHINGGILISRGTSLEPESPANNNVQEKPQILTP